MMKKKVRKNKQTYTIRTLDC